MVESLEILDSETALDFWREAPEEYRGRITQLIRDHITYIDSRLKALEKQDSNPPLIGDLRRTKAAALLALTVLRG